jgi:cation diffusion facilitator CzcD-associated flavoprotein CzcO
MPSKDYDLVIAGAGVSGLAAYFNRTVLGPKQRILILDNHDDLGGHAKRNELRYRRQNFHRLRRHIRNLHPVPI